MTLVNPTRSRKGAGIGKIARIGLATTLGVGLSLGGVAVMASAHIWNYDLSCDPSAAAASATTGFVDLTYYDSGATAEIAVDGNSVHTGTFGGTLHLNAADLTYDGTTSHTLTIVVVSGDAGYSFTDSVTADACVTPPPTKDASVSYTTTPATCLDGELLVLGDPVNATWDVSSSPNGLEGPAPFALSATADSGHLFSGGDPTWTASGDLDGPVPASDPTCWPSDAIAAVTSTGAATCYAPSTVNFGTFYATITDADNPDNFTVGDHVLPATSFDLHHFANGTTSDTVAYTIYPADPSKCPQDAQAFATVTADTNCVASDSVVLSLAHATIDGGLLPTDPSFQTQGEHFIPVTAEAEHLFPGGFTTAVIHYVLEAPDTSLCSPTAAAAINPGTPSCVASATATVGTVEHASLVGTLDQSVGDHTAPFQADPTFLFPDLTNIKLVHYTNAGQLSAEDCVTQVTLALTGGPDPRGLAPYGVGLLMLGAFGAFVAPRIIRRRKAAQN